jgi:hypothetical protein
MLAPDSSWELKILAPDSAWGLVQAFWISRQIWCKHLVQALVQAFSDVSLLVC